MAASHSIVSSFIISTQTFITFRILSIPKRLCSGLRMILNSKRFLTSHKRLGYDLIKWNIISQGESRGGRKTALVQHGTWVLTWQCDNVRYNSSPRPDCAVPMMPGWGQIVDSLPLVRTLRAWLWLVGVSCQVQTIVQLSHHMWHWGHWGLASAVRGIVNNEIRLAEDLRARFVRLGRA